jgi:predicted enzyme related to lactoylglutathione lyase
MGKRSSYPPGTFSWVDLATTDSAAAKSFYSELFGWQMEDEDAGDGAVYTLCRLEGDAVAGLFEMSAEMREAGVPTNWTSYVTVEGADADAARANELGGEVMRPPFDVMDIGRMAILKDPQGAVFAVWQPRARIGAERVNDVGCLCMNELTTTDVTAAGAFYEGLLGWRIEAVNDNSGSGFTAFFFNGGRVNASVLTAAEGVPSHWRPNFTVEDVSQSLERVEQLGGGAVAGPFQIFDGMIALARDPQGAVFALFAGETEP